MTLDILKTEMVAAMKDGKKLRKETIASIIGACKYASITAGEDRDNPSEELVNQVILKEKKTMQEMIDTCPMTREQTLEIYYNKMEIINEFAPKQFTEDELRAEIRQLLTQLPEGLHTQKSYKGMVMKELMPKLKGKADGKLINKIICEEAKV